MASSDSLEHINNLPDGILLDVFRYLPLAERKTAALVCRLWEHEAFSKRLLTDVRLRISCHMMNSRASTVAVLQKSSRPYRNVIFKLCGGGTCSNVQYAFIVNVLDKFGSKIEGFTIKRGCSAAQLKDFADRMPNLKSMAVRMTEPDVYPVKPMEFPILTKLDEVDVEIRSDDVLKRNQFDVLQMAPNVQRLSITYSHCDEHVRVFETVKACANQLRSLDLPIHYNQFRLDELRFEKLEVLKLRGLSHKLDSNKLRHLFRGLRELKAAHLDFGITKSTLAVICSSCPKLNTLDIRADLLEIGSLRYLDEMPNLQVFMVNYLYKRLLEQGNPIKGIKELHLHADDSYLDYEAYVDKLYGVFPNVSNMKFFYRGLRTRIVDKVMTRHICRKFINLTKLTISGEFCLSATVDGFDRPGDLGNVEELYCVKASVLVEPTSNNHVKRLILVNVDPIAINIYRLQRSFPELQYLEIRSCRQINPETMAIIRRKTPDCIIHYVHTERKWV